MEYLCKQLKTTQNNKHELKDKAICDTLGIVNVLQGELKLIARLAQQYIPENITLKHKNTHCEVINKYIQRKVFTTCTEYKWVLNTRINVTLELNGIFSGWMIIWPASRENKSNGICDQRLFGIDLSAREKVAL